MIYYRASLLLSVLVSFSTSSLLLAASSVEQQAEHPQSRVLVKHPAVKRLIFELSAEGYERRAALIEKGIVQDELSFLRLMYESYKVVDRSGLPSSYISYMDEMLAWVETELPKLKASPDASRLILSSYQDKLAELSQKYKVAHATLTSQNHEFRALLDESGFSKEMVAHLDAQRDSFQRDPKKTLIAYYRFMASRLRELARPTSVKR